MRSRVTRDLAGQALARFALAAGSHVSEFAVIGLLSGVVAAIAASILAGVVAVQVFDLPFEINWGMAAAGAGLGMLAALAAGLFATRRVLDAPPSLVLRELDA